MFQHVIFPVDCLEDGKCKVSSLLGWADTAGGCSSKRYCRERTVTASLDGINFSFFPDMGSIIHIKTDVVAAKNSSIEVKFIFLVEDPYEEDSLNKMMEFGSCYGLYITAHSSKNKESSSSSIRPVVKELNVIDPDRTLQRKTPYKPFFNYCTSKGVYKVENDHLNTQGFCFGGQSLKWILKCHEDCLSINRITFLRPITLNTVVEVKYYDNGAELVIPPPPNSTTSTLPTIMMTASINS